MNPPQKALHERALHALIGAALCLALLVSGGGPRPAAAQETGAETLSLLQQTTPPPVDRVDLAVRYGRVTGPPPAIDVPDENVGAVRSFWVMDFDADAYNRVSASLAYRTADVSMWVQEGAEVSVARVVEAGDALSERIFPAVRALLVGEDASAGVAGDGRVHVLHAFGLGQQTSYFNSDDLLPEAAHDRSNERPLVVVNLAAAINFLAADEQAEPDFLRLASEVYYATLARDYARLVRYSQNPTTDAWLDAGFAALGGLAAGYPDADAPQAFWEAPGTQLTTLPALNTDAHRGAALLFTAYVRERYGDGLIQQWAATPGRSMDALDAALRAQGHAATALDLFADWVVTNAVNDASFADGRYAYQDLSFIPPRVGVDAIFDTFPLSVSAAAVNPFGAQYLVLLGPPGGAQLTLSFEGADTVPLLPLEPHSGRFVYWSNRGADINTTLTRAFDLRSARSATLSFWAWYDTDPYRHYAYVSVSNDSGATWTALPATTTTYMDPIHRAFGEGFTGRSGGLDLVAYPYLGVAFGEGLTISDVSPGGPADAAGLQRGDTITAVNSLRMTRVRDLSALLDTLAVGDVVTITFARAGASRDVEATLGAHPAHFRPAPPSWVEQTVDLSAYAGSQVLVRFEYVTDQGVDLPGFAIDDIRIEAIGYFDDAESEAGGWQAEGWVRTDNTLPARFLVQLVQGNTVTRLLDADDAPAGSWPIILNEGEAALLVIANVTPFTTLPASYTYALTPAN
mgnify:CR=1 FL=1